MNVDFGPRTDEIGLRMLVRALDEHGAQADLASPAPPSGRIRAGSIEPDDADFARVVRLRDRLAYLEQRERELSALYETAQDLTGLRDVEQALHAIVRRARQLMNSGIAYLSAYDPERDDFYVRATVGTVSERFQQIRVEHDVGVCGHVAREKRPYYSSDYLNDARFLHDRNIDEGVGAEEVVSILGVPLIVDDQVIGVLFVADRYTRAYSPPQIALLTSLAAHAALAIDSARLFEATERALAREREANLLLLEQTREVEAAAEAHDQFASLIARGGDLRTLSEVIANELGGEVVILGEDGKPILATRAEACVAEEGRTADLRHALSASHAAGRSVVLEDDHTRRVAAAVGAGSLLGGILLSTERELSAPEIRTLERSAVIAALVLLSQERVRVAEQRAITDLVTDLVRGRDGDPSALANDSARRGVDFDRGVTVIAVDAPGIATVTASDLVRHAFPRGVLVGQYDGDLLVLINADGQDEVARSVQGALASRCASPVTVAYTSSLSTSPAEVPAACDIARRVVRLLLALDRAGAVESDEGVGPYVLLFSDHGRARLDAYVRRTIGELLDHDEARGTELASTLRVYLDLGGDAKAAAARLYVHPNTLRQRLRTVARVAPALDGPPYRIEVHLALRLRELQRQRLFMA